MKKIVLVPARGGSKRLPNKNILDLCGKPLICHTIDMVKDYFDLVVVPTDSDEIIEKVEGCADNIKPIKRPPELAVDTSKVLETICWYFDNYLGQEYEQIWMCLPTCPLRNESDVEMALLSLQSEVDSVVSITDFEFPVSLGLSINDIGLIEETDPSNPFSNGNTRSQDHTPIYRPNGAFYGSWCSSFGKYRNFFKGRVKGFWMPRERSIDIDTELDLLIAESVWKHYSGF